MSAVRVGRISEALGQIADAVRETRVPDGLALINARARYRFTGLFLVDGATRRSVAVFDRENPDLELNGDSSVLAGCYCAIVAASGHSFVTFDARSDDRLIDHSARYSVVSYAGVPVRSAQYVGTLCHFDARPRLLPSGELELLEAAASLFSDCLTAQTPS